MKIEKFIQENLCKITDRFTELKISYYKNILSESHILFFENMSNKPDDLEDFQADFLFDILDLYDKESIIFTDNLEHNKYLELLYQAVGSEYSEFDWTTFNNYESDLNINIEVNGGCKVVDLISEYYYAIAA
ncbi:hypothetical protein GQF61_17330 [Sphingobacterium sp. DK4209]|uniref:Uncharacterized protein n=1 Tax=Sphingobacterium zhuxiongii TaxID=2662364 RepID=A0A5Q0Q9S0_9SPHI|nr:MULTISPECIES: hypothetical protein [unclassified Sphingobacterium]MVZ67611.1 hypothetical protein [Sphingobacterium sp. DK4209]QGA26695.1 hypothetical protein GFH32_10310 [Sphingobacterium sp. dk4302]